MPVAPEDQELYGRVFLWRLALDEVHELLYVAEKIDKLIDGDFFIRALDAIQAEDQQRYETLRLAGQVESSYESWQAMRRAPGLHDTLRARQNLRNLAAVLFCQLEATGHGHVGSVADNRDSRVRAVYRALLAEVFPTEDERATFAAFITTLKEARDRMLGHADAPAFRLHLVEGEVRGSNAHFNALAEVDVDYWQSILLPLRRAIGRRLRVLEGREA